jgi:PIN domain nuclease of toxin-antitoxin system
MAGAPVKYLLDTAVWCHLTMDQHLVPGRLRELVAAEPEVGLASVSLLEVAILHRIGKLQLEGSLADFFAAGLVRQVQVIELSAAVALETNALPALFNGDPFDRTVAATARVLGLVPITTDAQLRDHAGLVAVEFYPFKPRRRSG